MMTKKEEKVKIMRKIEFQENLILELERWEENTQVSNVITEEFGGIYTLEQRDKMVKLMKSNIQQLRDVIPDNDKIFLSELIKIDKVEFKSNSLIISPVGSGKTTLINELKKPIVGDGKILMLVSNTTLKNSIAPDKSEVKKDNADGTYTTQNKSAYGDLSKKTHVMSYAEFGNRIRYNDDFVEDVSQIFCDEIHSLPDYKSFSDASNLAIAIKYLFSKREGKEIFYFTATKHNLDKLISSDSKVFRDVDVYDYLEDPRIMKYVALSEYKINGIDQIRPHLKARANGFKYFGYKSIAFNKTISGQKRIAEIAEEEGYKPLVLWSINNNKQLMDEEQLRARELLISTGYIPEPYNFLIINSAMQEGWNLKDEKVKLAIMNTVNDTERVQAVGRLRRDLDILVYRVDKKEQPDIYVNLSEKYINRFLTTEDKRKLCNELDIRDKAGRKVMWTLLKGLLENQGYEIIDTQKFVNKKRVRVSKILITI